MYRDAYVDEMEQRFADYLNSKDIDEVEGAQSIVYGCSQYHIEDKARAFLEENPCPTGRELLEFCIRAIPEGLSPEDDGEDLISDDEVPAAEFEMQMIDLLRRRIDYAKENEAEDAAAFAAACEEHGLEDSAIEFVQGCEKLTAQDLWHWLARMQPAE